MLVVETQQTSLVASLLTQQLQLEEFEDRSWRNNLQIRSLPDAMGTEDLAASTLAIFCDIAGDAFPPTLTFDWIHRALGP